MSDSDTARISPTAYATGYFWYAHGLSHPALATPRGRRLHYALKPFLLGAQAVGGLSMDALMLSRHRGLDEVLQQRIARGEVRQVIEIAAGLSPRGLRLCQQYPGLRYLETDLPAMAAVKRRLLDGAGLLSERHEVVELDALRTQGPASLEALAARLDPTQGLAIVTEGLMNYLDPATAQALWQRIAEVLKRFAHGVYLSDVYLQRQHRDLGSRGVGRLISAIVRGRIHVHFDDPRHAAAILRELGFAEARTHLTHTLESTRQYAAIPGGDRVQILEASV